MLRRLDLAKPKTQNFGSISSLTWRSRKKRSARWRPMWVHSYEVSSKSDYKWQSFMDFKFSVFGTKMGLWPWKVVQGRWKWVSVIRSTRGPYMYINVKKLQFNQVLTATCIEWHIENSKNVAFVLQHATFSLPHLYVPQNFPMFPLELGGSHFGYKERRC